jgi:uncharacterized membrane protein
VSTAAAAVEPRRLPGGFRDRGAQVTRLEAFVDAAFAFSVTLLVISLDAIPASIPALIDALKGVPAFAMSFLQIALFWHAHVTWSRRYGLDDMRSTVLSLLLVFLVLVYVYPLKILFGTFFSWITQGWIPWPLKVSSFDEILQMFVIYGLAFATLSACVMALYLHALRQRHAIGMSREETASTVAYIAAWGWGMVVAIVSIASALLMPARPPMWLAGLPGMMYFLMNLTGLVSRLVERRYLLSDRTGLR